MKIDRLEMIDKINAMIKNREEAASGRRAMALIEGEQQEKNYVAEHAEGWALFVRNIQKKMKSGRAVTVEDIPADLKSGYGNINVFRPNAFRESDYVPRVGHLKNLLTILESSPDEFVTTNALVRMGAPLRDLVGS